MRFFRKEISSFCVSREVSISVSCFRWFQSIRTTIPNRKRAMVMKSPSIHWRVSKRLLTLLFMSSNRLSMDFCPSSNLFISAFNSFISPRIVANPSIISLSLILGAVSTAIADVVSRDIIIIHNMLNIIAFFMLVILTIRFVSVKLFCYFYYSVM